MTLPTADDAKLSLTEHVAAKGAEIHARYGPALGWEQLRQLLNERAFVRYPCEIRFDASGLHPGEFAHPAPCGEAPEDGFTMFVHPLYETQPDKIPYLVLYQLVAVNYGDFASHEDAEVFASAALGLGRDEYYEALCALADQLDGPGPAEPHDCCGGGGGCGCSHG
jgi:hypothetical protein